MGLQTSPRSLSFLSNVTWCDHLTRAIWAGFPHIEHEIHDRSSHLQSVRFGLQKSLNPERVRRCSNPLHKAGNRPASTSIGGTAKRLISAAVVLAKSFFIVKWLLFSAAQDHYDRSSEHYDLENYAAVARAYTVAIEDTPLYRSLLQPCYEPLPYGGLPGGGRSLQQSDQASVRLCLFQQCQCLSPPRRLLSEAWQSGEGSRRLQSRDRDRSHPSAQFFQSGAQVRRYERNSQGQN